MNDPLVKIEHLTKRFGNNPPVLNGIDLDVYKGEIIAFIGPSGTGKSTLLRCLNYLTEPTGGTVSIDNVSITAGTQTPSQIRELRKHSAMVFQNYNLFKNKTAIENIMEALIVVHDMSKKDATIRAMDLLAKVGMSEQRDYYPSKLSGGQQQRIAIARAVAVNPTILLLDEPTLGALFRPSSPGWRMSDRSGHSRSGSGSVVAERFFPSLLLRRHFSRPGGHRVS